jgi:hypothetical protein
LPIFIDRGAPFRYTLLTPKSAGSSIEAVKLSN